MNRACTMLYSSVIILFAGFVGVQPTAAQESTKRRSGGSEEGASKEAPVTMAMCIAGDASRRLTLVKEVLPDPSGVELIGYLRDHPDANSLPNVAFMLVESGRRGISGGRVIWVFYAYENKKARPLPSWTGDVVWDSASGKAYVTLVKSVGSRAGVQVFRADRTRDFGRYPLKLVPKEIEDWPECARALSPELAIALEKRTCTIARTNTVVEDDQVIVRCEPAQTECRPVESWFDLKAREWAEETRLLPRD